MNLRSIIREALDSTTAAVTSEQIAIQVAQSIPARDREAALAEALPYVVRQVIASTRQTVEQVTPTTAPTARSWKRDAIRAAEQKRRSELDSRWATDEGYKRLGDFTYDNLIAAAERMQALAEANAAQAARFRALAAALQNSSAETVADLDGSTLADLGVAA